MGIPKNPIMRGGWFRQVPLPDAFQPAGSRWFPGTVIQTESARLCFKLLLLFVVSLYALPGQLIPGLDALHPTQAIAVAALALLVVEKAVRRESFALVWPEGYLLLAFVGAAGLSTFSAFWPLRAYEASLDLVRVLIVYLLIVNTVTTGKRLRAFQLAMVIGGLFPAIGTISGYLRGELIEGRGHWIGIFGNPNELGYVLVMVVPLAVVLSSGARYFMRLALWISIAVYVTAVYLTFSRGALLGLFGVLLLLAIRQRGVLPKVVMGLVLAGGLMFLAASWVRSDGSANQEYTYQQRIATIRAGVAMFTAHPLLGVGINCAIVAYPIYAPEGYRAGVSLVIHNTMVQALGETGILGFVPFVLLIVCSLYHSGKLVFSSALQPAERRMAVGLQVSLWGAAICGLSGGFLLSWFPYLIVGLIAATRQMTASAVSKKT